MTQDVWRLHCSELSHILLSYMAIPDRLSWVMWHSWSQKSTCQSRTCLQTLLENNHHTHIQRKWSQGGRGFILINLYARLSLYLWGNLSVVCALGITVGHLYLGLIQQLVQPICYNCPACAQNCQRCLSLFFFPKYFSHHPTLVIYGSTKSKNTQTFTCVCRFQIQYIYLQYIYFLKIFFSSHTEPEIST